MRHEDDNDSSEEIEHFRKLRDKLIVSLAGQPRQRRKNLGKRSTAAQSLGLAGCELEDLEACDPRKLGECLPEEGRKKESGWGRLQQERVDGATQQRSGKMTREKSAVGGEGGEKCRITKAHGRSSRGLWSKYRVPQPQADFKCAVKSRILRPVQDTVRQGVRRLSTCARAMQPHP